ncbi:MAG: hypothetical protein C0496_17915 [Erythrobacter sp.]|nr:hypothetical protein [Erythrobacter sp.]
MQDGTFEPEETNYFLTKLPEVDTVVNVGANYGYYTLLARSRGKHVIAFEPHPLNYPVLLRNLQLNNWEDVEVFPVAVADETGLLRIFGSGTGASLVPGWAGSLTSSFRLVPVTSLDRMLGQSLKGQRLLFLIDVEGAEYRVLRGAVAQLKLDPPPLWLVEISVSDLQPQGTVVNPDLLATFDLFWAHGYTAYLLSDRLREVTPAVVKEWISTPPDHFGGNFVFSKISASSVT